MARCDDCCNGISSQAEVYNWLKTIDPWHATVGAVNCDQGFMFKDYESEDGPTVGRSEVWLGRGQPALQLSLDLVMHENYRSSIAGHASTGWWNNSFDGPSLGSDGNLAFGMWQEPVVNCNAMVGYHGRGYYPMAAQDNVFPASHFRSVLWMGAVTANMLNQLSWLFGTDGPPYGPWQQTDMAAQWKSSCRRCMLSLEFATV